jgi:acyl-CoA synthetase (AMP-forming)/AMP-acid ligase II
VTHYCGAPIVHAAMLAAPAELKRSLSRADGRPVKAMVAGAAPPAAMIEGMEQMGFDLTHVYGLTEIYGPAAVCVKQAEWDALGVGERAHLNARQGVSYHLQRDIAVMDALTMQPVPADGETMGEIMFRGNITMKGYLKNPKATQEAFAGGWFHTGDLAVMYPDGYVKIKDRSKDIIISGGENISSIEVEDALYRHPAVVAKPDEKWGETPCVFIELKAGAQVTAADIVAHCRLHLAGFKVPRAVVFSESPKNIDRQDPEVRAAQASGLGRGHRRLRHGFRLSEASTLRRPEVLFHARCSYRVVHIANAPFIKRNGRFFALQPAKKPPAWSDRAALTRSMMFSQEALPDAPSPTAPGRTTQTGRAAKPRPAGCGLRCRP